MQIRLQGTRSEILAALVAVHTGFLVHGTSRYYPNRGPGNQYRLYVTATPKPALEEQKGHHHATDRAH